MGLWIAGAVSRNVGEKVHPLTPDPSPARGEGRRTSEHRLKPAGASIGKTSDSSDLGCRYRPEMIEMCKKALVELRAKGIIKF